MDPMRTRGTLNAAFHDTLSPAEADHGSHLMGDKFSFLSDWDELVFALTSKRDCVCVCV